MPGFNNNRFVVSFRDKSEYDTAFEKESMMDESTGELLTRTPAGDVLSYDYYQRLNRHVDVFTDYNINKGLTGDIFNISPSSTLKLPSIITNDTELLDEPITLMGSIHKFSLSSDADIVISDTTINSYNKSYNDYSMTYTYEIYHLNNIVQTDTITVTQDNIMSTLVNVTSSLHATKLKITSIKINNLLNDLNTTYKIILNSITLFVDYTQLVGLIGISINTLPTKTTYSPMDANLDLTGMVVNAYYADDTTEPIDDYTVSGWRDRSSSDTIIPITVEYNSYTDNFNVYVPGAGFLYIIEDETVTILRYIGTAVDVSVPSELEGYPVRKIEATAFSYTNVSTINIPEGVTEIG